jgi:hypothetical protein
MNRQFLDSIDSLIGVSLLALLIVAFIAAQSDVAESANKEWSSAAQKPGLASDGAIKASEFPAEARDPDQQLTILVRIEDWDSSKAQSAIVEQVVTAIAKEITY